MPSQSVTITQQNLPAGAVLGRRYTGGSPAAAAVAWGNNTGNGAMGAITVSGSAKPGVYRLIFIGTDLGVAAFVVKDPDGGLVAQGKVGTAFVGGGLSFTLAAGGTAFVVGDGFNITVSGGTFKHVAFDPLATTGEQTPIAILSNAVDATGGDQSSTAIVSAEVVNFDTLAWHSNVRTLPEKMAACALLEAKTRISMTRT